MASSVMVCVSGVCMPWPLPHGGRRAAVVVTDVSAVSRGGGPLSRRRSPRYRPLGMRVFATDALPDRASFFNPKLLEKLKVRLGFGEKIASSPGAEEELERELVPRLQSNNLVTLKDRKEGEETVSLTPDELFPEVMWEQREKDVRAEERQRPNLTSPGFSFSAAGHLFPYHLGVCECLMEHGYLTAVGNFLDTRIERNDGLVFSHYCQENTPLAGSSAGALVCAVVGVGLKMSDALRAAKEVSYDCRTGGTAFRLGAVLRGIMDKYLPEDAHVRVNGRIRVAVTQVFRKPRGLLVDQFDSKEDLVNALHTSCFIPGYFAPKPVTVFRDRICIDGGFTLFMPPTAADQTIRICAFFASAYNIPGVQISPDCNPSKSRPTNQELLNLAFQPAEDDVLDEMFRFGYEDALCWVKQQSK